MQGSCVISLFLFSCLIQLSPSQEPGNPDLELITILEDCDQQIQDCLDKYHMSPRTRMDTAIFDSCIQLADCPDYAPAPMSLSRAILSYGYSDGDRDSADHKQKPSGVSGLISCKTMIILQVLLTAFYHRFC